MGPVPLFRGYIHERRSKSPNVLGTAENKVYHVPLETPQMTDRLFSGISHKESCNTALQIAIPDPDKAPGPMSLAGHTHPAPLSAAKQGDG